MAAVIFDLDDTLYPHVQYVHSGFAAVAHEWGPRLGLNAPDLYASLRRARETRWRGREFQRLCETRGLDPAVVPDMVRVYRAHAPQIWLSHGAGAALRGLRDQGWTIALLTNGVPSVQAAKVLALGLEALVDHVVYAGEHAEGGKPAREPFIETLRRLQVGAAEAVMVGDDPANDVDGARAVGIRTIFLAPAGRLPFDAADAVVHLLSDVPRVASELLGLGIARAA